MRSVEKLLATGAVIAFCTFTLSGAGQQTTRTNKTASSTPPSKTTSTLSSSAPVNPDKSQSDQDQATTKLPVRRIVLYKTGVGYFEHVGHVSGKESVRIDFTSNQLNDVLQSLTVLDLGGGRIVGVNYNSEAPVSRRMGMLRLPLEEKTNLSEFYSALRGARLEVRTGSAEITGRLLSVERKTRVSGGTTLEVDLATIVSDSGEVRTVEITPSVTVRMEDHEINQEVGRYISLLASVRPGDLRR